MLESCDSHTRALHPSRAIPPVQPTDAIAFEFSFVAFTAMSSAPNFVPANTWALAANLSNCCLGALDGLDPIADIFVHKQEADAQMLRKWLLPCTRA